MGGNVETYVLDGVGYATPSDGGGMFCEYDEFGDGKNIVVGLWCEQVGTPVFFVGKVGKDVG